MVCVTHDGIQGHVAGGEDRAQHLPRRPRQRANARNELFVRKGLTR